MLIKLLSAVTAVNSPPTNVSTVTITTDTVANIANGDYITIDDGLDDPITFEFRKDSAAVSVASRVLVDISADTTAANVRDRLKTAMSTATHPQTADYPAKGLALQCSTANSGNNVLCTSLNWLELPQVQGNAKSSAGALTIGAWSGSTQGSRLGDGASAPGQPSVDHIDELLAKIRSTAGSGTMTASIRVWVLDKRTTKMWTPLGAGTDSAKGMLNQANAANSYLMGETSTDQITHVELITGMAGFNRAYFEVVAINGTSTAIDAYLTTRGHGYGLVRG